MAILRKEGRYSVSVRDVLSDPPEPCGVFCAPDHNFLGGDNNLIIAVSEYDPFLWGDDVHCSGSTGGPGIVESCNGLADRMDASESLRSFGPHNTPHDYLTPYTLTAGKSLYP